MTDRTLIFLHIPKTGGTTLSRLVVRNFPSHEIYQIRDPKQPRAPRFGDAGGTVRDFMALPEEERARFRCILGHMHFGIHEHVPGPSWYITLLRDPVERVLSQHGQYNRMVENGEKGFARRLSLEAFLRERTVADHQTRFLCGWSVKAHSDEENLERAKHNLREHFCVVGTLERFNETMLVLGKRLGWSNLTYVRQNVGSHRLREGDLGAEPLGRIERDNRLDRALHAFADELLDQSMADYGAGLEQDLRRYVRALSLVAARNRPLRGRWRRVVGRILRR